MDDQSLLFTSHISSLQETENVARFLSFFLKKRDVLALKGDLGMGKTTFSRFLIQILSKEKCIVPSPTFTLVQTYETSQGTIYHFDAYRLNDPEEIIEIGLEDALEKGISLIEWPEKVESFLPPKRLTLDFHLSQNERQLFVYGDTTWKERLRKDTP